MNLPNKLTLARIFMIPLFAVFFYVTAIPYNFIIATAIFCLAAITDFLDGYIARKYDMVTNFGKFLDPIADKVLVSSALIFAVAPPLGVAILPWYAGILVALILARELIISGFRLVAAGRNLVIAADKSGKIKTFFTDISIVFILISAQITPNVLDVTNYVGLGLLAASCILTVYSGAECIIKNRAVLKDEKSE